MKLRCGGQHADTDRAEHGVEGGGELRVPVPDQVSEPVTGLLKLTGEIAGELGRPLACGVCRDAEQLHPPGPCLDDERDIRRWRVNTQSTSVASSVAACARRKARQDSSRCTGGGTRWARRILRMVEAATRCPSRRSSPWMRTTPQRRFSRASRKISAASSSGIGGRPGGLGWRHFAAAMRRCQRSSVPGVTIRRARSAFGKTPASAASTARSLQDKRGLGVARAVL